MLAYYCASPVQRSLTLADVHHCYAVAYSESWLNFVVQVPSAQYFSLWDAGKSLLQQVFGVPLICAA